MKKKIRRKVGSKKRINHPKSKSNLNLGIYGILAFFLLIGLFSESVRSVPAGAFSELSLDKNLKLDDLNSRCKNFLLSAIEKPEDDLMFALILKNLSDRQISIDKKLIDFIIKRIDRSYGKIFDFIYKIDEISLKRKKPIDFKIIKELLGE